MVMLGFLFRHNRLPVIVFLHGGSNGGRKPITAALFDASPLATKGNVIVVTLNYRIGILG